MNITGLSSKPKKAFGVAASPMGFRDRRTKARRIGASDEHFGARDAEVLASLYPSPLSFYDSVPGCDLSLADFEALAVERLKLLRIMEKHSQMSAAKFSDEWRSNIAAEMKKSDLGDYDNVFWNSSKAAATMTPREREEKMAPVMRSREKDHLSHYILRLAYCSTEELRRWMIAQECDLFRYRAGKMGGNLQEFIAANGLHYNSVELKSLREQDPALAENLSSMFVRSSTYFKVHFTEALDLVRGRRVHVEGGFCFVPETEMLSLVAHIFRQHLAQALVYTNKILPGLNEDERIVQVVGELNSRYTGADYTRKEGEPSIKPEMIKPMAEKNDFPLCMRSMQATLDSTHHLKYRARLQYGLFLKGIGLSLEDAIRFFRGEFTRGHVDADKFDKEYAYGIRYNYGKEGKKVNWAPWNCMRIINESVGPGENHGCPYRHSDPEALRALLSRTGMDDVKTGEILQAARDGHYQKACSMQFEATHFGQELSTGLVNHPNQFCSESVKGPVAASNANASKVKTEKVLQYAEVQKNSEKKSEIAMDEDDPFGEEI